jgi:hypothetical protein
VLSRAPRQKTQRASQSEFSLRDRLAHPSTLVVFGLTVVMIACVGRAAQTFDLVAVRASITTANGPLLLCALVASVATYPLRGARWRRLLTTTNLSISLRAAVEILTLSFWVNVVLPAKVGDLYRAWLLRKNGAPTASSAVGTIVAERLIDLATVALLGAGAALVAFGGRLTGPAVALVAVAAAVAAVAIGLLSAARFATTFVQLLPLPVRVLDPLRRALSALRAGSGARSLVSIAPYSLAIWLAEALRFGAVAAALGLFTVAPSAGAIGISATIFTALVASLLTAIPFTPAGIGLVEAGSVGLLVGLFGMRTEDAIALALLDRAINIGSLLLGGGLLFALSPYRRGAGVLR